MLLIDFKLPPKQSFKKGFLKGMAAPVVMFGNFSVQRVPSVQLVKSGAVNSNQAMSANWKAVNSDLSTAIVEYGTAEKA